MRFILSLLLLLGLSNSFASDYQHSSVKFKKGNFFAITSQFNRKLFDDFNEKVLTYKRKKMYIYIDSPGGSVIALSHMARIMKSSNIKFVCVASFAASAAFILFQHCHERLILSSGVLMSHNWSGTFSDEAPRILTLYNTVQSLVDTLEEVVINKMSVNKTKYAALINDNLWMPAGLSERYNAVDAVVDQVTCSKSLIRKRIRTQFSFGGKTVYKSGCPLIQKAYLKKSYKNKTVKFIESNITLFELSQRTYQVSTANLIYTGLKRN